MTTRARRMSSVAVVASVATAVAVVATTAACTPGPLNKPSNPQPMNAPRAISSDASTGNLETTRRQLLGTWDLVALESVPPGDTTGRRVPIQASGTLTYDEFGNLTITAKTTDAAAPVAAREVSRLSFKGRAVIDWQKQELKLMDLTGNADPNEVLAPERRRKYEVGLDTLKLSSFDEKDQVTAISSWHRRAQ